MDNADFDAVYKRFFEPIKAYLIGWTHNEEHAEELTQETLFKAFRFGDKYDPRYSLVTWLYRIARNVAIDDFRGIKPPMEAFNEDVHCRHWQEPGLPFVTLTAHQRRILELKVFCRLDYEQIAQQEGISVGAVKGLIYRVKDAVGVNQ